MSTKPSSSATLDLEGLSETLILRRLEVYNWGPFARTHVAEFDPAGTSVIGPTGSGKTTLVDALMTLIVANPKYNLASTGGHDSDRDLMSYVRGTLGHGTDSADASHVSRPGKTVTGLAASFARPGRTVTLGAVLWADGTSTSAADCKKRWLIHEGEDESLEHWLTVHHEGGARALKAHCRDRPRLELFETKRTYLARVRRLFDIGENAFDLLNRAAGLKQLDSVDQIFRELVLDDRSGFKRASQVATEFDDLAGIRAELETARRQQKSLQPLVAMNETHQQLGAAHELQLRLAGLLTTWFAEAAARLWTARVAELAAGVEALEAERAAVGRRIEAGEAIVDDMRAAYLAAGGADIDEIDDRIDTQRQLLVDRRRSYDEYVQVVNQLRSSIGLAVGAAPPESTSEHLAAVHAAAAELRPGLDDEQERIEDRFQRAASLVGTRSEDLHATEREHEQIAARPDSNIPVAYQAFRSDLAAALGLDESDLPFVAELVSVKRNEAGWRGAIERAIGGHRLRVLVPGRALDDALRWVNHRDNRLHVRLEAVAANHHPPPAAPFADSFLHKLDLRDHPYRPTLERLLASVDRHCVENPEALRSVAHGMTREGLLSGRTGRFEKHDRRPLDQDWVTGFDNKDRLAELATRCEELAAALDVARADYAVRRQERDGFVNGLRLLESIERTTFDRIDVAAAAAALASLVERRDRLASPDSETFRAKERLDAAKASVAGDRKQADKLAERLGAATTQRDQAERQRQDATRRTGTGLSADDAKLADDHLPDLTQEDPEDLPERERTCRAEIGTRTDELRAQHERLGRRLVHQMNQAKIEDTGDLVDVGTDLSDLPAYLERLRVLTEESLPKRQRRFMEYLNQSSDQGVSSLLETIEAEVDTIVNRIADLNRTLRKVDFQPGRYLELRPTRVAQQALRDLERARKALAAARLTDDHGEAHYRALQDVIHLLRHAADNKATVWARALLDPRHRLTFAVAVLDRASDQTIEVRTSSEGGSGGEKEIIASYILTASLSYALCPDGAAQPLFGTIVLDEAFSKSSQTVAARIIDALAVFGLHPLFVTPNKELSLLRANTRSAILVNRRNSEARLTAVSWEELDRLRPVPTHGLDPATNGQQPSPSGENRARR